MRANEQMSCPLSETKSLSCQIIVTYLKTCLEMDFKYSPDISSDVKIMLVFFYTIFCTGRKAPTHNAHIAQGHLKCTSQTTSEEHSMHFLAHTCQSNTHTWHQDTMFLPPCFHAYRAFLCALYVYIYVFACHLFPPRTHTRLRKSILLRVIQRIHKSYNVWFAEVHMLEI